MLRSKCGPIFTATALSGRRGEKAPKVVVLGSSDSGSAGSPSKGSCAAAESEGAMEASWDDS